MPNFYLYLIIILCLITLGNSEYYSFQHDILAIIHFKNSSNLQEIQSISFVDNERKHISIDILNLDKEKNKGLFYIPKKIFSSVQQYVLSKNYSIIIQENKLDSKIKFEKKINRKQYFKTIFQRIGRQRILYYMRFDEIKRWIFEKVKGINFMQVENIGYTEENREIILVKISKDKSKPIIWIDAGIHAREWISPSTALFLINKLLEDSERVQNLLERYQFYIVPLINPDGYEYTHTVNRLWRKNRVRTYVTECNGVDLNRNFPYQWGGAGSSNDPCSRIYRGDSSASEKETISLVKKLTSIKSEIILFITLHSFGQYIMTPFGYSRSRFPRQYYKLIQMASKVSSYLRENYGRTYQVGSSANLLYEASGASDDYVAGELRIPYTYTIELPDRGRYGFILPPTYIQSVGNQFWDGLYTFTTEIN